MSSWLVSKVKSRMLRRNKNWLCVVCGPTGSGKSYTAIRLGEIIDPNFSINNVVFTPQAFMALINSGTLRKGSIIVFDEAGVGLPARDFYTISNKQINYVLQTFRFMNIGVIFTVPDFKFIDLQARKLFHTYIETLHVDRKNKVVHTKVKEVQNNPQLGKLYIKYYRKGKQAITRNMIGKPSEELVEAYEKKKKIFARSLSIDVQKDIRRVEARKINVDDIIDEILLNPKPYIREKFKRKYINRLKIEADYNVGKSRAARIKHVVEERLSLI